MAAITTADRTTTAGLACSARASPLGELIDASVVFAGVAVVATDRSSGIALDDGFAIELLRPVTFAMALLNAVTFAIEFSPVAALAI
jgi:hypothetical protein